MVINPLETPWAPKQLAQNGNYIGRHRMPEFEFTWKNHPIHVMGSKIYCMVCDNPSLASLTIGRDDTPCRELRSKWRTEGLSTRILDTDSDRAFMNSERLTQMARCVIASAIQAISDELRINPDLAQHFATHA